MIGYVDVDMTDSDKAGASEGDLAPAPRQYERFRFADLRQERIYRRLKSMGPGPAAFFLDASRLMATKPSLESTTHLVTHLLREVEGWMCQILETPEDRALRESGGRTWVGRLIDALRTWAIRKFGGIRNRAGQHQRKIENVLRRLGISEKDEIAQRWLKIAGELAGRAHRGALRGARPVDAAFLAIWNDMQVILDAVLAKYETRYLEYHQRLDDLLKKAAPTRADVKALQHSIPSNYTALSYFFDRLTSAAWIGQLNKSGFFSYPPPPHREEDPAHGVLVSFPPWPQTRYLARMASAAPNKVMRIIEQMPATENIRVHEDILGAALAMPATLSVKIARKTIAWIETPYRSLLPKKLGELMGHLSRGGKAREALDLARPLLAVLPDPDAQEKIAHSWPPEPHPYFDAWEYGEILKKHVPDLVSAAGGAALEMLCDLLQEAVKLSRLPGEQPPADTSFVWRPAVEEHEQNRADELRGMLVAAVRDAAESLIEAKGRVILDIIEKRPYRILHRIGLHLRRKWPQADPESTAGIVVDPEMLGDPHLQHELHLLLQKQFGGLARQAQEAYLSFVEEGPDIEAWSNYVEQKTKRHPDRGEAERHARHWRFTRLLPIQAFLKGEWKKRFEKLTKEFKPPEHPEFPVYSEGTWGPTSPKTAGELRAMSVQELVSYLRDWRPDDPFGSSREALARQVAALAASEPDRIGGEVERFQDPVLQKYVRCLMWGFNDAAKQKASFPWEPVLGLCRWVIGRPRDERAHEGKYEEDPEPGWAWTRKAIADLLSSGFEKQRGEHPAVMPFEFRDKAWKVLLPLTDDPDPQPEEEGGMDPATHSINSTRGEAMHAVVRYAWWVKEHTKADTEKDQGASWFDEMPEVREVLYKHLDLEHETSPAIRAVYGQWLPRLTVLDSSWVKENLDRLFPREERLRPLRDAAWNTCVTFNYAYDSVFELLREQYRYAVEHISETPTKEGHLAEPDEQLAEHLMALYWRGKLDYERSSDLLRRFYEKAPEKLRRHAIEFVGRSLKNTYDVPSEILERLKRFWQWRVEEAAGTSQAGELVAFGWWFVSGKFNDAWAVEQLRTALELTGKVKPDFIVAEHLAKLASNMPREAVECLRLTVEGDKDNLAIHGWREHARTILERALASSDRQTHDAGENLVHELGARGHLSFRDLLPRSPHERDKKGGRGDSNDASPVA